MEATVEVEYPTIGLGCMFEEFGLGEPHMVGGELLDSRAAVIDDLPIPTAKAVFPLYDDGTHGDVLDNNAFWSATLDTIPIVDGMYKLRYMFDLTKNGCTTHRELVRSVFIDVTGDPVATTVQVLTGTTLPDGRRRTPVRFDPEDGQGNCWGPGRPTIPTCAPVGGCQVAPQNGIVDEGRGSYVVNFLTPTRI